MPCTTRRIITVGVTAYEDIHPQNPRGRSARHFTILNAGALRFGHTAAVLGALAYRPRRICGDRLYRHPLAICGGLHPWIPRSGCCHLASASPTEITVMRAPPNQYI